MAALSLSEYVAAVTALIDTDRPIEDIVSDIVPLKRRLLEDPSFVPPESYEGLESVAYTRNLLHSDPFGRFSVLALVWAPRRESPIHDHATWGVVGTLDNRLMVTDYEAPRADGCLTERSQAPLEAGAVVAILPPRELNIHKMANPYDVPAISIHTYGDRALECRAYNRSSGYAADINMKFHHVFCRPDVG